MTGTEAQGAEKGLSMEDFFDLQEYRQCVGQCAGCGRVPSFSLFFIGGDIEGAGLDISCDTCMQRRVVSIRRGVTWRITADGSGNTIREVAMRWRSMFLGPTL